MSAPRPPAPPARGSVPPELLPVVDALAELLLVDLREDLAAPAPPDTKSDDNREAA